MADAPSNVDAPSTVDAPTVDGPPALAPFCDASGEPTLVGCWEFEDTVDDASGEANHGTATNTSFAAGKVGVAVQLSASSHIALADTTTLRPPAITIEGWINPTASLATRMGIFDNDGKYGFFLQPTGLQCVASVVVTTTSMPPTGQWTHVACTYDGATARVYLDGVEVGNLGGGSPLGTASGSSNALAGNAPSGDTLVGLVDQVRVWNVARTPQQICLAAGLSCP